jgi:hypothetical protein
MTRFRLSHRLISVGDISVFLIFLDPLTVDGPLLSIVAFPHIYPLYPMYSVDQIYIHLSFYGIL